MKKLTLSLFQKSLLTVIFILLPVIILTFFYNHNRNKENLKKYILNNQMITTEVFEGEIYQFLEMSKKRALDFSSDYFIKDNLQKVVSGNKSFSKELSKYLKEIKMPLDRTIHEIYVISLDGRIAGSTDASEIGMDVSNETFFKNTKEGLILTEDISGHERVPEIYVSTPVLDRTSEKQIGILVNFILLTELDELINGSFIVKHGGKSWFNNKQGTFEAYIVNKDNLMLTRSRFIKDATLNQKVDTIPVRKCFESTTDFSGFYKDYRGIDVIGASACMPQMKWTLVTEIDTAEVERPLLEVRNSALKEGAIIIGVIGVLFIIFLRNIVMQLRRISYASKEIAEGNYNIALPVKSNDEIGTLSDSFNRMVKDIKERTKLLQESEGRLGAIIDNSTTVFYLKDTEGRYLLINKSYEELFKITKEEIKGKTDFDVFPKDFASKFRENDIKVLESRNPLEFEEIVPQDDGVHHYISVKFPIYDPHENIYAVCGISTDITRRKQAEKEANLLQTISLSISEAKDFHSALKVSLSKICEITGWLFGEVWLPLPDKSAIEFSNIWCGKWEHAGKFADLSNEFIFRPGIGLPGRVWLSKKPEWIRDVSSERVHHSPV